MEMLKERREDVKRKETEEEHIKARQSREDEYEDEDWGRKSGQANKKTED